MTKMRPIHPGEILKEDFMELLGLTGNRLALDLRVPATRIHEIVNGRRSITADTALRLARYFGTSAEFWMNLQAQYDIRIENDARAKIINAEVAPSKTLATR